MSEYTTIKISRRQHARWRKALIQSGLRPSVFLDRVIELADTLRVTPVLRSRRRPAKAAV